MARPIPLDVWLLVFDELNDLNALWSACRNVSRFLRACVDEYFRHGVLQNTFVNLMYSDINTRLGPQYQFIHIPLVFDRFSDDGSRAVFQQRIYREIHPHKYQGSVRGWVPFIERYHKEIGQERPVILNKSRATSRLPRWEREYDMWKKTLHSELKKDYLLIMAYFTSIARGDRPPFSLKVGDLINDTDLVDIVVDCKQREVSFNWRQTYANFFREQNFCAHATKRSSTTRVYDKDLEQAGRRYSLVVDEMPDSFVQARRKRLAPWVEKNKDRMSPEIRLWTEIGVAGEKARIKDFLRHENLAPWRPETDTSVMEEEVPEKLAKDHPDILFSPWIDPDGQHLRPVPVMCMCLRRPKRCTIL
ncbi:hypothetical protein K491DRAFT_479688 [Lophiostoma macrostomum CBS 122681]|uniref:F-box domain-containing protein n=1 Tax=Lophiostoma macrostomum CBS 122681 TaxID=1314788 RepID=A0A6A6TPP3_9PLEO|nr:hypothetical protein K491DRAFT_479688 [Lophiostoma macrostomum CBS 122681]